MPDVTPERMKELAKELRGHIGASRLPTQLKILDAIEALEQAARLLAPQTGKPEKEGEYLVAVNVRLEVHYMVASWNGSWLLDEWADRVLCWWPLPPVAKEET